MSTKQLSLKAFWDALEQRLADLSHDELRAILRAMAQDASPTERQAFLERLNVPVETAPVLHDSFRQDDLLAEISDVAAEFKSEMKRADQWEESHGWDDHYDDEDSLGPYEDFVDALTDLFDRVAAAFDYGDRPLARTAYPKLFEILDLEDDYGRGVRGYDLHDVDLREACARYLRAVYETEPMANRVPVLFEQLLKAKSWVVGPRPMVEDLIQISSQPLPDREQFFADWIAFLRKQTGKEADAWLREAIRLSQGAQGLEALAHSEGAKRPHAYLDWVAALEQEGKPKEVLASAQEALRALPDRLPIRAAIADHLCAAAAGLNDTRSLREGRWEAFAASPTLSRLLDLWDAIPTEAERTELMQQATQHVKNYLSHPRQHVTTLAALDEDEVESPVWVSRSLLAHACLLARDLEMAHQLAKGEEPLGWSHTDNSQGLVVSFFLVLLSGETIESLPPSLKRIWEWGLQNSIGFERTAEKDTVTNRLERAYADCLPRFSREPEGQGDILSWCVNVTKKRVEAIVTNQRRHSYDKAAVLVAACAETLRLRGNSDGGDSLVDEVRNRFPRHRAFQDELRSATQQRARGLRR